MAESGLAADIVAASRHAIALVGAGIGLVLPLAGTFMEAALHHGGVSLGALGEAQASSPLLWLVDTVPAVMGFLAFLVGRPEYLTDSPNEDQELAMESSDEQAAMGSATGIFPADPRDSTQRWGILEASRQISAVRSASIARTQAMRALPPPPRDSEGRPAKPSATPTSLDDLLKEELR